MVYKYLEHTADAKFRAFGKNFEEALSNAVTAMFGMMTRIDEVESRVKEKIEIKAEDMKSLVFDFLDELLYLLDTKGIVFTHLENVKFDPENYKVSATAVGDLYKNYEMHGSIKAVTYNEMVVEKEKDKYVIQVVVDI